MTPRKIVALVWCVLPDAAPVWALDKLKSLEPVFAATAAVMRIAILFFTAAIALPLHAGSTVAPEKIYAQELVNQMVATYPDLLVVAMHVTPPKAFENVIIASNIGRIGKKADAEDLKVIRTGETLAKVNKNGDRFEVELVLHDASQKPIGALAIVFPYRAGDDKSQFEKRAEMIRDELGRQIPQAAKLMEPSVTR
jgi:hypothetical protein